MSRGWPQLSEAVGAKGHLGSHVEAVNAHSSLGTWLNPTCKSPKNLLGGGGKINSSGARLLLGEPPSWSRRLGSTELAETSTQIQLREGWRTTLRWPLPSQDPQTHPTK